MFWVFKIKFPIIYKKLYENGITYLISGDFAYFNVSSIKYRVRYRQNCVI